MIRFVRDIAGLAVLLTIVGALALWELITLWRTRFKRSIMRETK